jgi:hypothetical protein
MIATIYFAFYFSFTLMKKVSLIYCNTMLIPTASSQNEEIVCTDIDDFVKYEHHCSRVVEEMMLRDLKVEAKQYGSVIVLHPLRDSN